MGLKNAHYSLELKDSSFTISNGKNTAIFILKKLELDIFALKIIQINYGYLKCSVLFGIRKTYNTTRWILCRLKQNPSNLQHCYNTHSTDSAWQKGYHHLSFKVQCLDNCLCCFLNGHFFFLSNWKMWTQHGHHKKLDSPFTADMLGMGAYRREWLDRPLDILARPTGRDEPGLESKLTVF